MTKHNGQPLFTFLSLNRVREFRSTDSVSTCTGFRENRYRDLAGTAQHTHSLPTSRLTVACARAHTHTHTHTRTHARTHARTRTYARTRTHARKHTPHTHSRTHARTHVNTHTHTHTHTHIHTHTVILSMLHYFLLVKLNCFWLPHPPRVTRL